jgi:hypothetical protein
VAIYETCSQEPTTYLELDYVPGGSLADGLTGQQALPVLEGTQALIDACKGVGAARFGRQHAADVLCRAAERVERGDRFATANLPACLAGVVVRENRPEADVPQTAVAGNEPRKTLEVLSSSRQRTCSPFGSAVPT